MTPAFKVTVEGSDITRRIADRLLSLRVTDAAGWESDTVEIVIDDRDWVLELPRRGVIAEVWLGYVDALVKMGRYRIDEVEVSGPPNTLSIRGKSAEVGAENAAMKQPRNRSWKDISIGSILEVMATEADMTAVVADTLVKVKVKSWHQTDESNVNFLTRLAKHFGAVAKVADGRIIFVEQGMVQTASGRALSPVTVALAQVSDWDYSQTERGAYESVTATYVDRDEGEEVGVRAGGQDGANKRLRRRYETREEAQTAAESALKAAKQGTDTLSLTLPGRADLFAEHPLVLEGFRPGLPVRWVVQRVEHTLDRGGFQTTVDAELQL